MTCCFIIVIVSLSLFCLYKKALEFYGKVFDQWLKQGGTVRVDLQKTSRSKCYGGVMDHFGIEWQLSLEQVFFLYKTLQIFAKNWLNEHFSYTQNQPLFFPEVFLMEFQLNFLFPNLPVQILL